VWLFLLLFSLAAGAYWLGSGIPSSDARTHVAVGKLLDELSLEALTHEGEPITSLGLGGQVVVINFWGTWCPPCRAEFPYLVSLFREYQARAGFQFLSVSCGNGPIEDEAALRNETRGFLDQFKAEDLPIYFDRDYRTRLQLVELSGGSTFGYPMTVVLDQQTVVRGVWNGYQRGVEQEIQSLIVELMSEAPS